MHTSSEPTSNRSVGRLIGLLSALTMAAALTTSPAASAKGGTPAPAPAPAPAPSPAPAQLTFRLSFDDFIAAPSGVPMPAGYGGFTWGDRWYAMQNVGTNTNYLAVGSGLSIVIRRADGTPFYFDGADFWSRRGLDAVGDFYFVLYYQGQTVYNGLTARKGKQVFSGTPTLFKPEYTGPVDGIAFAFDSNGLDWNHLAMDNFRFRVNAK